MAASAVQKVCREQPTKALKGAQSKESPTMTHLMQKDSLGPSGGDSEPYRLKLGYDRNF